MFVLGKLLLILCSHTAFIFLKHKTSGTVQAKADVLGGDEGWMLPKGWGMRGNNMGARAGVPPARQMVPRSPDESVYPAAPQ